MSLVGLTVSAMSIISVIMSFHDPLDQLRFLRDDEVPELLHQALPHLINRPSVSEIFQQADSPRWRDGAWSCAKLSSRLKNVSQHFVISSLVFFWRSVNSCVHPGPHRLLQTLHQHQVGILLQGTKRCIASAQSDTVIGPRIYQVNMLKLLEMRYRNSSFSYLVMELAHPFLGLLSCHDGKIWYNSISENDEKLVYITLKFSLCCKRGSITKILQSFWHFSPFSLSSFYFC